ncbi:hypothetical protein ASPSYDRAFT_130227 [Aspergillus sydowii CBS 593.65]|uniref:Glycosyl transferase 64 domain-containing protein n=1 Tax=Aspergillus sydowii CBS 593.65 TaxID=1036612 RepID=A0A1L9TMA4_9EURO|nr:uncharacterized protein ASPSYDRAFT_130227 [Aspergillus sydowii CBS 593.65]OJJ60566.1 hypothetical protein ASPSYDRAFT_130227 [Aspergillus sydowii CBS 593.65]
MTMAFRSASTPRISRSFSIAVLFIFFIVYFTSRVPHVVNSHLHDISYEPYFQRQFQAYVLTTSCGRFTSDAATQFDSNTLTIVPNRFGTPECNAVSNNQLRLRPPASLAAEAEEAEKKTGRTSHGAGTKDNLYREKYAQVLDECAAGSKAKCLILEDDVVFLHNPERTREVLIENTIPLFNDGEYDAFDCTKRGFGWLPSTHTGMGTQCRVYSKSSAKCMSSCLRGRAGVTGHAGSGDPGAASHLDIGLANCQIKCGLKQKRFLLVVHGGIGSTMERPEIDA